MPRKRVKKFKDEFAKFAIRGNVVDLAVGVIIGAAFAKITNSLVNDIVYPLLSPIMGSIDLSSLFIAMDGNRYPALSAVPEGVATLNYGSFITVVIDFLVIALAIFIAIHQINKLRARFEPPAAPAEPTEKPCPYCQSSVSIKATRCPFCTSDIT